MSTERNSDNKSTDTDTGADAQADEAIKAISPSIQQKLVKIESEARELARFQSFARINNDWNPHAVERLHTDLAEFISQHLEEHEAAGIPEVAIVLWDELSRVEHMMRQDSIDASHLLNATTLAIKDQAIEKTNTTDSESEPEFDRDRAFQ